MLLEAIKNKINSLEERRNQLEISSADREEIERKVNELRQSLLDSLEQKLIKEREIIDGQVDVLKELILTEETEKEMEEPLVIPYEREES